MADVVAHDSEICVERPRRQDRHRPSPGRGTYPDERLLQVDSLELRELLEEWGERHTQILLEALTRTEGHHSAPRVKFACPHGSSKNYAKATLACVSPGSNDHAAGASANKGFDQMTPVSSAPRDSNFRDARSTQTTWTTRHSGQTNCSEIPMHGRISKSIATSASGEYISAQHSEAVHIARTMSVWTKCRRIVERPIFGFVTTFAILANAGFIGWFTDWQSRHLFEESPPWARATERVFCIIFAVELVMRLMSVGCREFFSGESCRWNIFDLLLVLHSLSDLLEVFVGNASFLRILRLARVLKLLRVLRLVKGLRELRFILNSILNSVKSTVWSVLLVVVATYMFGLIFLQAAVRYLQDKQTGGLEVELLKTYWGSLSAAMLTLLKAGTGGQDWGEMLEPLVDLGKAYVLLFLFYLLAFLLVVMNTVTGLFVEATMNQSTTDRAMVIQTELEKKQEYIEQLSSLYQEIDADGDGRITVLEFLAALRDTRLQAFIGSLNIDASDTVRFFQMLTDNSDDPSQGLDLETFVVGCIKLRGEAKAQDIYEVKANQKNLLKKMSSLERLLQHRQHRDPLVVSRERAEDQEAPHGMSATPSIIEELGEEPLRL